MVVLEPRIVDFVVVLETTANMVDHWDSIMKSYIRPALEYFNGKGSTAMDYIGNNGNSHYGYVLFHSDDSSLEPMTTSAVIQSPSLFIRKLDSINFSGGGSERCCFVAEGLGRALKVFDDISTKRNQRCGRFTPGLNYHEIKMLIPVDFRDSTKVCILVCGSPPHDIPCYETREHFGKSYEELAKAMGNMNVHLSVISPHHIKQMKDMYRFANQPKSTLMNYARDLRHLVLISGFELPTEQTPVKVEPKVEPAASSTGTTSQQPIQASSSVSSPSIATSIVPSTYAGITNTTISTQHPQTTYTTSLPPSISQPHIKQEPQPSVPTNPTPFTQSQVTNFDNLDKKLLPIPSSAPAGVPYQGQVPQPRQIPVSQKPSTSVQMHNPVPQAPIYGSTVGQPTPAHKAAEFAMAAAMQQQQKPVWSGLLEWNEKRAGATGVEERTLHQLNCEVVVSRNATEENIGGSFWPEKLIMQLVPRIVLTNDAVKPFLRNVPVVILKLSPHDQSVQLCNLMSQRWMGVINVPLSPSGMSQQGDARVILIIHSPTQQATQPLRSTVFPPNSRPVTVTNQHFRQNVPARMNEVRMPGMMGNQARQMEFVQTQQVNNPGQPVSQPNVVVSQNPGNPQQRYPAIIRHPQGMTRLAQQHPRMRPAHQQAQQPQITLNRPSHPNDNVRALLTGAANNNANQAMGQQQRPGMVNTGMGQPSNMGFMQTPQMRHTIGSRVMNNMNMTQQRFGMQ